MIHVKAAPDHKTALPPSGGLTPPIDQSLKVLKSAIKLNTILFMYSVKMLLKESYDAFSFIPLLQCFV